MPVTPDNEGSTFDSIASDLTAAVADGGAIANSFEPAGGLALLGVALDETTTFVPPTQADDMTSVDSKASCVLLHKGAPPPINDYEADPPTGATPSCECDDFYNGNPEWNAGGWTNLICTSRYVTLRHVTF